MGCHHTWEWSILSSRVAVGLLLEPAEALAAVLGAVGVVLPVAGSGLVLAEAVELADRDPCLPKSLAFLDKFLGFSLVKFLGMSLVKFLGMRLVKFLGMSLRCWS